MSQVGREFSALVSVPIGIRTRILAFKIYKFQGAGFPAPANPDGNQ